MSEITNSTVAELKALQAQRAELLRAAKAAEKAEAKEAERIANHPAYVPGSTRQATEEDRAVVGTHYSVVCQIKCVDCGETRLIGVQELFQACRCKACQKRAQAAKNAARRARAQLEGVTPEQIQDEINKLTAMLAARKAA